MGPHFLIRLLVRTDRGARGEPGSNQFSEFSAELAAPRLSPAPRFFLLRVLVKISVGIQIRNIIGVLEVL